jgi:polysaccharide biosynthesis protein PslH
VSGEILFLAHRVPWPPNRGDKIRSWNILNAIARLAPVHVVAFADQGAGSSLPVPLRAISASLTLVAPPASRVGAMGAALISGRPASVEAFRDGRIQARVDELMAERPIRTIYAYSGQMGQYVRTGHSARFAMDFVDMDSAKFESRGARRGIAGLANRREARRLFAFEKALASRADISLFVSEVEASLFRERSGLGPDRIGVLENGIDVAHFDPAQSLPTVDAKGSPLIVFTGQMDYAPNVEAVSSFARTAMPAIRAIHPNAAFAIVGRAPTLDVRILERLPGIHVTGEVDDTRAWLAAADIVVAPLTLARGIQNKVLEAMAMARPVVASRAAAEGIDAVAGRDIVVGEGAGPVLALLGNRARAASIGAAARARMIDRYGWDRQLANLPAILGLSA